MEIQKLIKTEIKSQQNKTEILRDKNQVLQTFSTRVNLRIEEDRLRNMLVAEKIAEQLAELSINNRNHLMFRDFKTLFPETYDLCEKKVTHL